MSPSPNRSLVGAAIALGYLLGTLPTAAGVARLASGGTVDLRAEGSGNPGATNAIGLLGKRAGAVVLVGDVGKGAAACVIGGAIGGPAGAHLAGSAAVAGHCYPVWNGFDGGKGVAAGVGQCLVISPAAFPLAGGVAVAVSRSGLSQRAFVATLTSSVCWVGTAAVWWRRGLRNRWGPRPTVALPVAAAVSSAIIVKRFVDANRSDVTSDPDADGQALDGAVAAAETTA